MAHNATVCFAKIKCLQDNLRLKRDHNIPVIHRISNQSWNKNEQNSHFSQVPSKWSFWLLFKIAFILFNCKNLSTSVSLNKCYYCLPSVFKTHVHFSEVFTSHYLLRKAKNVNGIQCNCLLLQDNLRSKRHHNIPVIHRISNQSWNKNRIHIHSYANCYVCALHEWESNVSYLVHLLARSFHKQACNCNSHKCRCCKLNANNFNGTHCNCLLFTILCEVLCMHITWVGMKCKLFSMSAGQIISITSMQL